jgi:hypothetical protein
MRQGFLVCIPYDEIGPNSFVLDMRFAWFFVLALLAPVDIKLFSIPVLVRLFYFNFQFPSSYILVLFFPRNIYTVLICIDTMRPGFLVCIRYDEIRPPTA